MGLACGIVGLPNAGKSTLFNALTATAAAETADYPFCTIEPNVGCVNVPDARLLTLASLVAAKSIVPEQLSFVDIAGLVKGASQGEGLGNQFLGHIREVDAILHVARCFPVGGHIQDATGVLKDIQTVETELMLADLQSLEKRLEKKAKSKEPELVPVMEKALSVISDGRFARDVSWSDSEKPFLGQLHLLTQKPVLYICNVEERYLRIPDNNACVRAVAEHARARTCACIAICAQIESEIAQLSVEERPEFLASVGLSETGLSRVIRESHALLGLHTFFTAGPKEARAWTIRKGATAFDAAGAIHTDFQKGFIRAEVVSYDDYVQYEQSAAIKAAGKMRLEGRDYVVHDGDVMLFRFNL